MSTKFRVPILGWIVVLVVLAMAVPQAESHSRKKRNSCTEGDPTCWVKPTLRTSSSASCGFWDADCTNGGKYYHRRYDHFYRGYSPHPRHHHHHHHDYNGYDRPYERTGWNHRYWQTRFYHRRYENYRHPWRRREYTWIDRDYSHEGAQHCLRRHRVVGDQNPSRKRAVELVETRWAQTLSYDEGGKYSNLDRAQDVKLNCDPTGQTTWAKRILWTCVIVATPCRAIDPDPGLERRTRFEEDKIELRIEKEDN
jgi:hypothetical protein